eukprot:SAG31_NODE_1064_length_10098_cov_3.617462_2_plen_117_part_00
MSAASNRSRAGNALSEALVAGHLRIIESGGVCSLGVSAKASTRVGCQIGAAQAGLQRLRALAAPATAGPCEPRRRAPLLFAAEDKFAVLRARKQAACSSQQIAERKLVPAGRRALW